MTTAAATSSHPPQPHGPTPARPHGAQGSAAQPAPGQRPAPADLFATLLALAADAAPVDGAMAEADAPGATDGEATAGTKGRKGGRGGKGQPGADDLDLTDDHPLAGLLLWQPPALDPSRADGARDPRGDTGALSAAALAGAARGTTPADADPALRATDAAPTGPARPTGLSWQVAATRAAQAQPTGSAASAAPGSPAALQAAAKAVGGHGADTPAMRWSAAADPAGASLQAVRSTVTLDARFPAAQAALASPAGRGSDADTDTPTGTAASGIPAGPAGVGGSGNAAQADGSGNQGGAGADGQDGPGRTTTDDPAAADNDAYADARADAEAVEVQHWGGAHGLRHASLRVGEEAGRAIDIQLALRGDEVRLDIRTDDSATRDALREQAQTALGERLQQGGLQLADVNVGGQQRERSREDALPTLHSPRVQRDSAETAAAAAPAARAPAPGRNASGGLDLFI